jgi:hypothetical protein
MWKHVKIKELSPLVLRAQKKCNYSVYEKTLPVTLIYVTPF